MSGQFSSAVIFVSVVAIAIAANMADEGSRRTTRGARLSTRGPSSVAMTKKDVVFGDMRPAMELKYTEKVHGAIYVKIDLLGSKPSRVGDVFVMRGEIRSEDGDLASVDFKWSLPAGVKLVSGQVAGRLGSLTAGQPATVELTLEKTSDQNEQVHLMAGATRGDTRMAESAQFNTDVQDVIDADRAAVKGALEVKAREKTKTKFFQ